VVQPHLILEAERRIGKAKVGKFLALYVSFIHPSYIEELLDAILRQLKEMNEHHHPEPTNFVAAHAAYIHKLETDTERVAIATTVSLLLTTSPSNETHLYIGCFLVHIGGGNLGIHRYYHFKT
jgi:hypothetical protein